MLSMTLIKILILFFILLISLQLFLAFSNNTILEGLETTSQSDASQSDTSQSNTSQQYQPYDTNNPNNALILAQQNAGNIQVLKQQITDLSSLKTQVQTNTSNVASLQKQVNGMVGAQQQYAQNMTSKTPPTITGAVNDDSS
jgi:hypothetical protein